MKVRVSASRPHTSTGVIRPLLNGRAREEAPAGEITTTDRSSSSHRSPPSMYLQIQRLAGGGAGRRAEEGGCRSVKAVG